MYPHNLHKTSQQLISALYLTCSHWQCSS